MADNNIYTNTDKLRSLGEQLTKPFRELTRLSTELATQFKSVGKVSDELKNTFKTHLNTYTTAVENYSTEYNKIAIQSGKHFIKDFASPSKIHAQWKNFNNILANYSPDDIYQSNKNIKQPIPAKAIQSEITQGYMSVLDATERIISQAAAASESHYKFRANEFLSKGNFTQAIDSLETAKGFNIGGNILEGATNIAQTTAAGAAAGSVIPGVGTLVGAGAGAVVGTISEGIRIWQEWALSEEEIEKVKNSLADLSKKLNETVNGLDDALEFTATLDDISNEKTYEKRREGSLNLYNNLIDEQNTVYDNIQSLKQRLEQYKDIKGEDLTDEQLANSQKWTKELAEELDYYNQLDKKIDAAEKLTDAVYNAEQQRLKEQKKLEDERLKQLKEEEKRLAEIEKQKIALDDQILLSRDLKQIQDTSNQFKEKLSENTNKFSNQSELLGLLSDITGINNVNKSSEELALESITKEDKEKLQTSINKQKELLKYYQEEHKVLDEKREDLTATIEELQKLQSLDNLIASISESIKNDTKLLNSISDGLKQIKISKEIAQIGDYHNQIANLGSSKFLTSDLGSFNRYFGKTDPSVNLIKETNGLLKTLIQIVDNKEQQVLATFQ
jgi:uncharacterized protein YdcH (DUF465 family)